MAVTQAWVSLAVNTEELTPEQITAILGVEPSDAHAAGTVTATGRVRGHTSWSLHVMSSAPAQGALDDALGRLADSLAGREPALEELQARADVTVCCSADSDSAQGGFWLAPRTLAALARLNLPVLCTVRLAEDESAADQCPAGSRPVPD